MKAESTLMKTQKMVLDRWATLKERDSKKHACEVKAVVRNAKVES